MRLVLVGVDPEAERILRSELADELVVERADEGVPEDWDDVGGVVLGLPGPEALRTVEQVYRAVPQAPVMVLASGERLAEVSRQVRFAPMLGSRTSWAAADDEQAVRAAGRSLARKALERRALNAAVHQENQRLAGQLPRLARLPISDLLTQVMQHAPVGMVVLDALGRVMLCSARATGMLGEVACLAPFADRFRGGEREGCLRLLGEAGSGQVSRRVLRPEAPAGLTLDVTAIPAGEIVLLFLRDASAEGKLDETVRLYATLREREAQLAAAYEAAEEAHRKKDEFLALLGHELRNPLAPIATAMELIKLKDNGALEQERKIVERQVRHLSRLVDDLLDVSRITRGRIDLEREQLEISSVLAKAVEMASPALEKKSQHVEIRVPREGLPVHGDPVRLAQVFQNLVGNASKFTRAGGHIRITARAEGREVQVVVADDGIGMPEDLLADIFDMFVQGERKAGRSEGGLGLGLTIVRSLVELHQGQVSARSEGPNRGSEFTVRLPLASAPAAEGPGSDALAEGAGSSAATRRVLVVDDNVDAAQALAEFLRVNGHSVQIAHDGPRAIELCGADPPDVAIVDIGLPVMDGYEVARRLRLAAGRPIELIALTGYGQEEDRVRSLEAGFDHHLTKPVDPQILRRLLE